jgi:predicted membrane protein
LNYSNWLKKRFPELEDISGETVHSYINEAKSSSQVLREFVKVLGFLLFVIPFNLFLSVSGIQSLLYWLLLLSSVLIGGIISLYFEQQLIKKCLRKIVSST